MPARKRSAAVGTEIIPVTDFESVAASPAKIMTFHESVVGAIAAMPAGDEIDCAVLVQPPFLRIAVLVQNLEALGMAVKDIAVIATSELGEAEADELVVFVEGGGALFSRPFGE